MERGTTATGILTAAVHQPQGNDSQHERLVVGYHDVRAPGDPPIEFPPPAQLA